MCHVIIVTTPANDHVKNTYICHGIRAVYVITSRYILRKLGNHNIITV